MDIVEEIIEKLKYYKEHYERLSCGCLDNADISRYDGKAQAMEQAIDEILKLSREYEKSVDIGQGVLKRIADYFRYDYEGDDKTAPKLQLSVDELRYIAALHTERCRLQADLRNLKAVCNNEWILCESGNLPEECVAVDVTIAETVDEEEIRYVIEAFYQEGAWVIKKNKNNPKVVAWKPKAEPCMKRENS